MKFKSDKTINIRVGDILADRLSPDLASITSLGKSLPSTDELLDELIHTVDLLIATGMADTAVAAALRVKQDTVFKKIELAESKLESSLQMAINIIRELADVNRAELSESLQMQINRFLLEQIV